MQKEVSYKTELKSMNKYFLSQINDSEKKKNIKKLQKENEHTIFVIHFDYHDKDIAFEKFHKDVDAAILGKFSDSDEVYLTINTPGGSVTAYADAAQQIIRLKDAGFKVTCFIDQIAASGGYMMASVCDKIIAQPFAFVGSIGVVAQMPIVEDLLSNYGVQFKVYTAGTKKRTVVPTKKPTEEEESHFKEKISDIHKAFKNHVLKYRPEIDAEKLMDGDYYMAQDVVEQKIVDEIGDSRSALISAFEEGIDLIEIKTTAKKKAGGLAGLFGMEATLEKVISNYLDKLISSSSPNNIFK